MLNSRGKYPCARVVLKAIAFIVWSTAIVSVSVSAQTLSVSGEAESLSQSTVAPVVKPSDDPRPRIMRLHGPGRSAVTKASAIIGAHAVYYGGPVISNVHVVQVLYGPGSYLPNISPTGSPSLAGFFTDITQSFYFDMLSEYRTTGINAADGTSGTNQNIGHGTFDGQFTINPSPLNNGSVITDGQIQTELLSQVAAGNLPAPVIDLQGNNATVYMIYFPPGKTITAGTDTSCVQGGFCAYHSSTSGTFGSRRLFYGVLPDVQPPSACSAGCGGGSLFDIVTNVTSHELSEAVTDPDVGPAQALARPLAWIDPANDEIADICVGQEELVVANGLAYTVQKDFSNLQQDCVVYPPALSFSGAGLPSVLPGESFSETLSVQGRESGINLFGYQDTVHFSSSDPAATLPADYTFTLADAGAHTFVMNLNTPGSQAITVSDTRFPEYQGSNSVSVFIPTTVRFQVAGPATATAGSPVSLFVTALDSSDNLMGGYSGTVHFSSTDPTAVLPPNSKLTNGFGAFSVTFNGVGSKSVSATDAANKAISGKTTMNVSGSPITSTATLSADANPVNFGQAVTYTATVTGGISTPTGSMNFVLDGGTNVSTSTLSAAGEAHAIFILAGGTHSVFAEYVGDKIHAPSSSSPVIAVVNPAPTNMVVNASPAAAFAGAMVHLNASMSTPDLDGFGRGIVTFTDGASPLAVVPFIGPNASFDVSSLSVGTHTIGASFSGNVNALPASASPISLTITPAGIPDFSVAVDKSAATISAGNPAAFTITTSSMNGFRGNVQFACSNLPALATCNFSVPTAVVGAPNNNVVSSLMISTVGFQANLIQAPTDRKVAKLWLVSPFLFGFVALLGRRGHRSRRSVISLVALFTLALSVTSCGGGGKAPTPPPVATPAGTSNIIVTAVGTATSGGGPAHPTQQVHIALTVR